MENRKLRIGVFGSARGIDLAHQLVNSRDAALVAVCDKYEPALERCRQMTSEAGCEGITFYSDFEDFFNHDMDAVVLANYAYQHAPYAIRFLNSGRHVLSEVLTCATLSEAVGLIEAVERSGMIYSYAENYGYTPARWEMRRRYRNGDIGEVLYAEGEYLHDCTSDPLNLWHLLTYGQREHWRNRCYSTFYCTHSLGPILQMTGLRPLKVIGLETPNPQYCRDVGITYAAGGIEMVMLENGGIVRSTHGNIKHTKTQSHYVLNGTKGALRCLPNGDVEAYIEDGHTPYKQRYTTYTPPVVMEEAAKSGHGGADFFTTYYFIRSILGDEEAKKNIINVYDAVDMCIPGILGYRSICNNNVWVEIPNLRNRETRDAFRNDTFCTFPDVAGDMLVPNNIHDPAPLPQEVYDRQKALWDEYEATHGNA